MSLPIFDVCTSTVSAGPAEAGDATKRFAPALTPLTGEGESVVDTGKAAVGGIMGTASELASSAVETVKQVQSQSYPNQYEVARRYQVVALDDQED